MDQINPFDLTIENQFRNQATPVLYIVSFPREDDDTQKVRFRFINKTKNNYVLKALTAADAKNFHFALVFRPSTLRYTDPVEIQAKFLKAIEEAGIKQAAIKQDVIKDSAGVKAVFKQALNKKPVTKTLIEELTSDFAALDMTGIGDRWLVSKPIKRSADNAEVIYFSAKSDCTVEAQKDISFLVNGLSGAAATGSRSTQVQLLFREPVGKEFIERVRNLHLDIVNHDGKTFAPLDFVMLGDPTLVHRSKDNVLRIQVVETNGRPITVSAETFIDFKFPFYKDHYDPNYHPAWVFGKSDNVNTISCQKNENEKTEIKTDTVGNDIVFQTPNLDTNKKSEDPTAFEWGYKNIRIRFKTGESINNQLLKFMHIPADGPIGDALIKITVGNLPGYWDTEFVLRVRKTLLSTEYHEDKAMELSRAYGMLSSQIVVGKKLPEGTQMKDALQSSLSITSAEIHDRLNKEAKVTNLLRLDDEAEGMNGMFISVGNKSSDSAGYLIEAMQKNQDTRFKVDFSGNLWAKGNITAVGDISVKGRVKDATGFVMPVGAIIAFGGSIAPEGWLLCDGQTSLSNAKYEELKKAINMNTTPDLRSRFVVGAGTGNGLSTYPIGLGDNHGAEKHILTVAQMPNHKHTGNTDVAGNHQHSLGYRGFYLEGENGADGSVDESDMKTQSAGDHQHTLIIENTGNDEPHNNLPPYYALTYIIKY
ncbi:MAG: hypothetical protein EAY75_09355 [Bacteroidetes bacterium]|nr:MAG: hypothetical protein EAY75_09355 [Bacteroidota bacterium]